LLFEDALSRGESVGPGGIAIELVVAFATHLSSPRLGGNATTHTRADMPTGTKRCLHGVVRTMKSSRDRKKLHHYVHVAYLDGWRDGSSKLYVYNLIHGKSFDKTGTDIGAEGQFNHFSFDPVVIDLLRHAFSRRLSQNDPTDAAGIMLALINWVNNHEYEHKEHNFFEDFYEEFEKKIGITLSEVKRDDVSLRERGSDWGLYLLFFYFLQLFRVPKARDMLSGEITWSTLDESAALNDKQRREFTMAFMLFNALCAASDLHAKGFRIRLRYAGTAGKLINSDSPAVVSSSNMTSLEELKGWVPLTPRIVMEVNGAGGGMRAITTDRIDSNDVLRYNTSTIKNARTSLFFSSTSQRADWVRKIAHQRHQVR
jgi:hypothetical protein